jgi:cell division transport system ATP-binding protein
MPRRSWAPGWVLAAVTRREKGLRRSTHLEGKEGKVDTNTAAKVENSAEPVAAPAAADGAPPKPAEQAGADKASASTKPGGAAKPAAPNALVSFDAVAFAYKKLGVLKGVTFSMQPGDLVFLVGPSGSGKTTLLRLAHGQLRPQAGKLVVDGRLLHRRRGRDLQGLRRRVGVVFQDYKLLERLTAVENVSYALRVADLRLSPRDARARAEEALREVGLGDRCNARVTQLSGGQQQRVAIARALAARPKVLLADEPTASLDEANAKVVVELLERIAGTGTAVLVATSDKQISPGRKRRFLHLNDGRLGDTPQPPEAAAVPASDHSAPSKERSQPEKVS